MGSWNGTCGISQLPIEYGDEILLFVLEKTPGEHNLGGGFSYATDIYRPVGLPVHGRYNDYGGIENITANDAVMLEFLTNDRRYAIRKKDGTTAEKQSLEDLLNDEIERGNTDYSTMLVRRDVLEDLKKQPAAKFNTYAPQLPVFVDGYNKEVENLKAEYQDEYHPALHDRLIEMELSEQIGWDNIFLRVLEGYNFPSLKQFVRRIAQQPDANVQDSLIDVLFVNDLFESLRKFWTVQSGAGSQDDQHDVHAALADAVLTACERRETEQEDW